MHAFIITGGTEQNRIDYIQKKITEDRISPWDQIRLQPEGDATSIGIQAVRAWQKQCTLAPRASVHTVGIIEHVELLSLESQHALLKTLEDPPSHTYFLLSASSLSILLPTILSRCNVIPLPHAQTDSQNAENSEWETHIRVVFDTSLAIGKRMSYIDSIISDAPAAKQFVEYAIRQSKTYRKSIRTLLTVQSLLLAHVSPKLAIDRIILTK